ncbi:hypothetical protein PUR71_12065 [Streptomyces sp. SP17BM10]|uniref:hypothetical protein n=1 Tax=Streptomyces sp. SP17BM10 TaxID=3002530 RepID=UPI002E76232F|nr:hypothetical protein [Streptomyces sp. SP17BM10]MEE1783636.1 hypothetical protein [Streptomyces sp. SP17BM10]
MFELLPETGLVLPRGAGVLRFGMSEREAQWAAATLADVHEYWVCQVGWAFSARYEGLEVLAYGDVVDRYGRTELDVQGLASVCVLRHDSSPTGPSAVPVVLGDVDLFGYPAAEVLAALEPDGPHPAVVLRSAPTGFLREAGLSARAL